MNPPSYKPILNWRNKKNASRTYPIHLRITLDRETKYFPIELPQKVQKEQWSDKPNAWIKITHPFAFEINNLIKEKEDILQGLIKRYFSTKKSLTFPVIFKELQKSNNTDLFNEYFDYFIKDPPETFELDTLKRYKACLKLLNRFNSSISFNDLSEELFQRFKKYCETDAHLVGSTINGDFNALKKVVNWARKDSHITKAHQESIFEDVHIKIGKPKKDYGWLYCFLVWLLSLNLIIPRQANPLFFSKFV